MKNYLAQITTKRAIIIVMIVVVSGALLSSKVNKDNSEEAEANPRVKTVQIEILKKQDIITSELTVSGTIVPREYSNIRSLTPGTIEFLVPVGEDVVRGQSLFSIRNANIESAYFNAFDDVSSTDASTDQVIIQAELQLNSKDAGLLFAKKTLESQIKQEVNNLANAQNMAIASYNSSYNALTQVLISIGTGTIGKSTYRYSNVLTSESQLRSRARRQFDVASSYYLTLLETVTFENIDSGLDNMHSALSLAKEVIDASVIILQNAVTEESATDLATVQIQQTSINTSLASVLLNSNTLKNVIINNDFLIEQDENRLELAQIEYDNALVSLENTKTNARIQNSSVRARFDAAAYSFGNLTLAAPFSGTILSHNVSAGEQITSGQALLEIGNLDIVEIDIDIDSSLATAVKINDPVVINKSTEGFISEVEPIGSITSGKVGIKIQSIDSNLTIGDVANVTLILSHSLPESIVIPIKAATIAEVRTTVFVEEDGKVVLRTVKLGIIFGDKVTVISGLSEGESIIIPDGTFIAEGDRVQKPLEN